MSTIRTGRSTAILWIAFTALAVLLVVLLLALNSMQRNSLHKMEESNIRLAERLATLQAAREGETRASLDRNLPDAARAALQRHGVRAGDLVANLMRHPELIPHEGTHSGTMGFYSEENITILTDRYVLAQFDDGHISGWMLLRYEIGENGKIAWTAIDSYLN